MDQVQEQNLTGEKEKSSSRVQFTDTVQFSGVSSLRKHGLRGPSKMSTYVENYRKKKAKQHSLPICKVIAKSPSSVEEQMKQRGYKMVTDQVLLDTPVKIEFNIARSVCEFNVRERTLLLLNQMKLVDPALKVKSKKNDTIWTDLNELPEDDLFNDHFKLKDLLFRKVRKLIVHLQLRTTLHINQLKYNENVKEILFQENIWLRPDRFDTRVESSPGVITMLSPKLVNRDGYTEELITALAAANLFIQKQAEEHQDNEIAGERPDTPIQVKEVPKFYLETSIKKWKDLKAEVIRVNCAKEDSEFLKSLLSAAYEQHHITSGVFLPEGLHLIETSELVYNILETHNEYIKNVTSIPLRGISSKDFSTVIPAKQKSIREMLLEIDGVQSIEKTRDRFGPGKWLVITTKAKATAVIQQIEKQIGILYKYQYGQTKLITAGSRRIVHPTMKNSSISTYAEILQNKYKPTHMDQNKQANTASQQEVSKTLPSTDKIAEDGQTMEAQDVEDVQAEVIMQERTSQLISPEVTQSILDRLDAMEKNQASLKQTQGEMEITHNQKYNEKKKYLEKTETKVKDLSINTILDKKLAEFRTEYENKLTETETNIANNISKKMDKKVEAITLNVANQVARDIMALFSQYLPPTSNRSGTPQISGTNTPMITQDLPATPLRREILTLNSPIQQPQLGTVQVTERMVEDKGFESENNTTLPCSTHDNTYEQLSELE